MLRLLRYSAFGAAILILAVGAPLLLLSFAFPGEKVYSFLEKTTFVLGVPILLTSGYMLVYLAGDRVLRSLPWRLVCGALLVLPISIAAWPLVSGHPEFGPVAIPLLLFSLLLFSAFVFPTWPLTRESTMQTTTSIEINRPIGEVFDYTIHHVAEWSEIVVKDEVIEEKPEGVGTTFRVTTEEKGHRMEFDGLVTHHDPPRAHAIYMTGKLFDIEAEYLFENLGSSTRITQHSTVHGKGFFKVIFFLFGGMMKKSNCDAQQKQFLNLKRLAEANHS
jgi:hypothetical protein